jgi:hypothetical protein
MIKFYANHDFDVSKSLHDHLADIRDLRVNLIQYTNISNITIPDDLTYFTNNNPLCLLRDILVHFAVVLEHHETSRQLYLLSHCLVRYYSNDSLYAYITALFDLIELNIDLF